jgi:hypothetical protein
MIDFESFLFSEPKKKPWSAFRFAFRFSLFARARASKQMHMYTLRERERAENENRKIKKIRVANEREVARADSAQVPRPFARQSRSSTFKINLKINRSIDPSTKSTKSKTVSYRNASLGLSSFRRRRRRLLSLRPAQSRTLMDTYLPKQKTKKINSLKNEGDTFSSPPPPFGDTLATFGDPR